MQIPRPVLACAALALALCGCAGSRPPAPAGPSARIDVARLRALRGYSLLQLGDPAAAESEFRAAVALAQADQTSDESGRWGLALALRLEGRTAESDSLILTFKAGTLPESHFAGGWFSELSGDTAASLSAYGRASRADSTWTPPVLRAARLLALRGEPRAADSLFARAAALGDTLAPHWRAAAIAPPRPSADDSLLAAAEASAALTRLQWAALLRRYGQVRCAARYAPPELIHFRAARDSLRDLEGTPWVRLARDAVISSRIDLYPDGTFRGDDVVTRGRFALWADQFECPGRAPAAGAAPPAPADLGPSDYRTEAVMNAIERKLLDPRPDGSFAPDAPMTGAGMRAALRRMEEGS